MTSAVHLAVYDGRERMGSIVERSGGKCRALDASGKLLGTFTDRKRAVDAIVAKYRIEAPDGCA